MLRIAEENIRLGVEARGWREAVRASGQVLVECGSVLPGYIQEMEKTVLDYGPYMIVAPGVAILHASPGLLVKQICFGIVTVSRPVLLADLAGCEVDVLIPFATPDSESHISLLACIAEVLMVKEAVRIIRSARTAQEISDFLRALTK